MKKVTVVTGGTSGIGAEVSKLISNDGQVFCLGRNEERLAELAAYSDNIIVMGGDITNHSFISMLGDAVRMTKPDQIDLIHSAGIGISQAFHNYNYEEVEKLFKTNVMSAFDLIDEFLPHMIDKGVGNICLVSSTAGVYGYKYNGAYCASKHALNGMVKSLAKEHGKRGIVATSVCPGVVDTPMTQKTLLGLMKYKGITYEQAVEKLCLINPQGRLISAKEVAEVIAFACSGKAPALNGSVILMGGGE